jgi:hypothetical protein
MYSSSKVAVDKGLGFDFSGIADLVKSAGTTALNIYQNQLQVKQIKELQKSGYPAQSPSVYGQQYGILPMSQAMQSQPTFGSPVYPMPVRSGMDTTTMLMIGAGVIGAVLVFKGLTR